MTKTPSKDLVLPQYINIVIYIVTWKYIVLWTLYYRYREILHEPRCWSSINTLHYIQLCYVNILYLHSIFGKVNNISCHDICSYRDKLLWYVTRNFYIVATQNICPQMFVIYCLVRKLMRNLIWWFNWQSSCQPSNWHPLVLMCSRVHIVSCRFIKLN